MPASRNPAQVLSEAKQIARDHGGFVVERAGRYLVYRRTPTRNVYQGYRGDPAALRAFVCKVFNFH